MKNLIITESQYSRLFMTEGIKNTFSFDVLSKIRTLGQKLQYCISELGPMQGKGSSRGVFQIDDEKVLKLALNKKGLAQNEEECTSLSLKNQMNLFPKVYDFDSRNYSWIVSEFVLPATEKDLKELYGINKQEFACIIRTIYDKFVNNIQTPNFSNYRTIIDKYPLFQEFIQYFSDFGRMPIGDLQRIENYGMAMRNGQPQLVILDSGLNYDILTRFY